jgi:hypothetical protein
LEPARKILIFVAILFVITVASCKVAFVGGTKTENLKPVKLYEQVKCSEFQYDDLNMKLSAEVLMGNKKETFSGIVRIQKDSIIWISLRAYSVEGARLCFTKDSIKYINRLNNTYYVDDFEIFAKKFGFDIDYKTLQSILTNSFFFYPCVYDEDIAISNFKQCQDNQYHCISSISKRKYSKYYSDDTRSAKWERKLEKEIRDSLGVREVNDFVFQTVKIMPEIFRIQDMYLENYITQQSLFLSYEKQIMEENQFFPRIINMEIVTSGINMNLKLNVESVSINPKSLSFPFKISDKYIKIDLP